MAADGTVGHMKLLGGSAKAPEPGCCLKRSERIEGRKSSSHAVSFSDIKRQDKWFVEDDGNDDSMHSV
jgi:hypothetical protein